MTTAPDLPLEVTSAAVPAQAEPARPALSLVREAPGAEIVDFDEALREATPRLVRYATRRLADPHEAEEVVQEALLRAFQHKHVLATEDDLMAWLTVVTGRLVIDRLRVRGRTTPVAELPPGSRTGRDTADVVVARDEARIALDALEAMPSRQAAVLWAREVEGLSYDEIGVRYDLSEPTVRSLLHRARRTLRREYAQRGGTFPALGLVALAPWMRGLRFAAAVRKVARKSAGAAATTATGLAIVTVAPLWTHSSPSQPTMLRSPHLAINSAQANPVHTRPAAAGPTGTSPTSTALATTATDNDHPQRVRIVPHACTKKGVGTNCAAPQASTLYLVVPTRGQHAIGLENSILPVDCTKLPATPLTHCQPSDRKN